MGSVDAAGWSVTQLSDAHLMVCLGGCSKGAVCRCQHNGKRWIYTVSGNEISCDINSFNTNIGASVDFDKTVIYLLCF